MLIASTAVLCLLLLFLLALSSSSSLLVDATAPSSGETADPDDFYAVLELDQLREDATERDIKSAFRKLSKQYHPDLKGKETREHYQRIQRAYDCLGTNKKRKIYDMKGLEGLKQLEQASQQGAQHQQNDIACQFFGQCGAGGAAGRGKPISMMLLVDLADIYNGAQHTVKLNKQRLCRHCKGTGADSKEDYEQCKNCGGSGHVTQRVQIMPGFVQQMQQPCPHCSGKGKSIKKKCHVCRGHKVTRADQLISVDIEVGIPENHELTFEMEADQSPDQLPGDVVFTVQSAPHKMFERKGTSDLLTAVRISLAEALLGFRRELTHLDGQTFTVEERSPVYYGQMRTLKGLGMPIHNMASEKGNLFVRYEVELPEDLSASQREQLKSVLPG